MIDKQKLTACVEDAIKDSDIFLVDLTVSADNRIVVELDSPEGLDIDTCARITRRIEEEFNRDDEDYELEVGSAGLTAPFKVRGQYMKNLGNEVEVITKDGRKLQGTLTAVNPLDFVVEVPVKVKPEGAKRPQTVLQPQTIAYDNAKSVKYHIDFK